MTQILQRQQTNAQQCDLIQICWHTGGVSSTAVEWSKSSSTNAPTAGHDVWSLLLHCPSRLSSNIIDETHSFHFYLKSS